MLDGLLAFVLFVATIAGQMYFGYRYNSYIQTVGRSGNNPSWSVQALFSLTGAAYPVILLWVLSRSFSWELLRLFVGAALISLVLVAAATNLLRDRNIRYDEWFWSGFSAVSRRPWVAFLLPVPALAALIAIIASGVLLVTLDVPSDSMTVWSLRLVLTLVLTAGVPVWLFLSFLLLSPTMSQPQRDLVLVQVLAGSLVTVVFWTTLLEALEVQLPSPFPSWATPVVASLLFMFLFVVWPYLSGTTSSAALKDELARSLQGHKEKLGAALVAPTPLETRLAEIEASRSDLKESVSKLMANNPDLPDLVRAANNPEEASLRGAPRPERSRYPRIAHLDQLRDHDQVLEGIVEEARSKDPDVAAQDIERYGKTLSVTGDSENSERKTIPFVLLSLSGSLAIGMLESIAGDWVKGIVEAAG